jgi:hypothetical protein
MQNIIGNFGRRFKVNSQNKVVIILVGLAILFTSEYIISSYQYNNLVNKILDSENIKFSYNEMYRPYPVEKTVNEDWGAGLTSIPIKKYEYTELSGTLVLSSSITAWNSWREDMQSIGSIKKDDLLEAQFDLEQVNIFPWRNNKEIAREKYLEHTEAWIKYLSSLIDARENSDLTSFFEDDFGFSASSTIAKKALYNGVPTLDLFRIESKLKATFAKEAKI